MAVLPHRRAGSRRVRSCPRHLRGHRPGRRAAHGRRRGHGHRGRRCGARRRADAGDGWPRAWWSPRRPARRRRRRPASAPVAGAGPDAFATLNDALRAHPVVVTVPRGVQLDRAARRGQPRPPPASPPTPASWSGWARAAEATVVDRTTSSGPTPCSPCRSPSSTWPAAAGSVPRHHPGARPGGLAARLAGGRRGPGGEPARRAHRAGRQLRPPPHRLRACLAAAPTATCSPPTSATATKRSTSAPSSTTMRPTPRRTCCSRGPSAATAGRCTRA